MIVRDEAHVVAETLDSVAPHIDYWVIVDTGSADGTQELIREHMAGLGIPGELHERPWRDFGQNRTEALELCRGKSDYAWVVDADDLVSGDLDLTGLVADSYLLRYGPGFRYWRKQLFRDGLRWRYEGVVHEYPACDDVVSEARLEGEYWIESRRLGARSQDPDKYERDARLLLAALARDPYDARSAFYLAQSLWDAGDIEGALEWYSRRAEMAGWDEERFYALHRRGECLERLDEPWPRARDAYLEAYEARPTRAEPLTAIARHHRLNDEWAQGHLFASRASELPDPAGESLFVDTDVYRWRARDERSICAHYLGRHAEALDLCSELLAGPDLPEGERERVLGNRDTAVERVREERAAYPEEIVAKLAARASVPSAEPPEITLTITSCRRLALFERTVNSFLRCCDDVERIGRFVCVDNGSSEADVERMRSLYPFFELVLTDPESEGHAGSMNRILGLVESPFWLHLEDDWEFFARGRQLERARAILADDPAIAQVAFNRSYGETLANRALVGGSVRHTADGRRYRLHEHVDRAGSEWQEYLSSLPAGALTNAYWPHFTLRPSLMRAKPLQELGEFRGDAGHFELEFADRFAAAGHRTAFFDEVNCLHIGRLTSEGPGEGAPSAYELVRDGRHPARPDPEPTGPGLDPAVEIRVINLDRRPDRWQAFGERLTAAAGGAFAARCERFPAVDGTALELTEEIRHLFRGNNFSFRRGIVGTALSHLSLWRELAAAGSGTWLVLEDDARPCEAFEARLAPLVARPAADTGEAAALSDNPAGEEGFDMVLLGHLTWEIAPAPIVASGDPHPQLRPMPWEEFAGGTFAYLLSARGAQRLVAITERDGIQNGIDTFVGLHGDELLALACVPALATADFVTAGSDLDSDIQHDQEPVAAGEEPAAHPAGAPRLSRLIPGAIAGELVLHLDPPWPPVAVAITADGDGTGLRLLVRTSDEGSGDGATALDYAVSLDEALRVVEVEPLADAADLPGAHGIDVDGGRLVVEDTGEGGLRFAVRNGADAATAASPAFTITGEGEERAFGLARRGEQLVIVFGVDGLWAGLAVVDEDEVLGLLEPC